MSSVTSCEAAISIYDPEIVCPRTASMFDAGQLRRFADCAMVSDAYMGTATRYTMANIMGQYYENWQKDCRVSFEDFNRVVGLYMRAHELERGYFDFSGVVDACGYQGCYGDTDNRKLLAEDLRGIAYENIVLVSDARCWIYDVVKSRHKNGDVWIAPYEPGCSIVQLIQECNCERWRYLIRCHPESDNVLRKLARVAFPSLRFSDSLFSGIDKLKHDYRENVDAIVHHLSVLNDDAVEIWAQYPDPRERIVRMKALGVECSGERGSTRSDNEAMRMRTAIFDGVPKVCEWHTKLHPNTDRIHFYVEGAKVYVGLFAAHCK